MHEKINIMLDVRSVYACDPKRTGAHYIRRHRIRLLRENPLLRDPELIGNAIVEVAHVDELLNSDAKAPLRTFASDSNWAEIAATLFEENSYSKATLKNHTSLVFKPNISFLRHIRIQPQFRGEGWGQLLVDEVKNHFRNTCGLMIAYSYGVPKPAGEFQPLLPDTWERDEPFPRNRLLRGLHFAGFSKLHSTDLFSADL